MKNLSCWEVGISSDKGPIKQTNEDQALFHTVEVAGGEKAAIVAVADGMGGYQAGDLASRTAAEMIQDWWEQRLQKYRQPDSFINEAVRELDGRFHESMSSFCRLVIAKR